MIVADAHRRRGVTKVEDLDPRSSRAVAEYLSVLDDAAFGGGSPSEPKAISPVDPAARYTAAANSAAVYAYSDNYLVEAAKTMLDRTAEQFNVVPSRLVADAGYGSAEMLGWLDERGIEPHVRVFDKFERTDGTFSRTDFAFVRAQPLCLPRRQRAQEAPSLVLETAGRGDERRHDDLLRSQARLRRLRAQAKMLPEHARAQDCALRS
jgi:hypothetical protein